MIAPTNVWRCGCTLNGLVIEHPTGTYCGVCNSYAPGCSPTPTKDVRDIELASLRISNAALRRKIEEYENNVRSSRPPIKMIRAYKVINSVNNNRVANDQIGSYFKKLIPNVDMKEEMVHITTMIWDDFDHHRNDPAMY